MVNVTWMLDVFGDGDLVWDYIIYSPGLDLPDGDESISQLPNDIAFYQGNGWITSFNQNGTFGPELDIIAPQTVSDVVVTGALRVGPSGQAYNVTIESGGYAFADDVSQGTDLGGAYFVYGSAGGYLENVTVNAGGTLVVGEPDQETNVDISPTASNVTVDDGGIVVFNGGILAGSIQNDGQIEFGSSFQQSPPTGLISGSLSGSGSLTIFGGFLELDSGSAFVGTTVISSGGTEEIDGGGSVTTVDVLSGAELIVSNATVTNAIVSSGGSILVEDGGVASGCLCKWSRRRGCVFGRRNPRRNLVCWRG